MYKISLLFFVLFFTHFFGQKNLELKGVKDFLTDDYGNIYAFKNKDFGFAKYDSLGNQIGKMMLVNPFKIQSVQNPLNIVLFSENVQEIKLIDQNLNEIQTIDLKQKFGFIKQAYVEDLQKVWLLDESRNLLLYYNFRDDILMNSFPIRFNLYGIKDIMIYNGKLFVLRENSFEIYHFNSGKLLEFAVEKGKRLSRENENVYVVSSQKIYQYFPSQEFKVVFSSNEAKIVDKNHLHFLALIADKFYLYKIK